MNNDIRNLINAVANSDMTTAKAYCKIIVNADKTKKDEAFCKNALRRLENLTPLPSNISNLLRIQDMSDFNVNRYYLSEREGHLFSEIKTMYEVAGKLADMNVRYSNSVLLYGDSGVGKTLFAEYLAHKMGLPLVSMSFANTITSYLGDTGKNLRGIFDYVRNTECVFFIDEIDAIGIRRGDSSEVGEISRIVIALMQEIDTLPNNVLMIAASNRKDVLDEALLRRFSITHYMKKLKPVELIEMINRLFADIGMRHENIGKYVKDMDAMAPAIVMNDVIRKVAVALKNGEDVVDLVGYDASGEIVTLEDFHRQPTVSDDIGILQKNFRAEFEEKMELGLEDCINWADWLDCIAEEIKEGKKKISDF